MLKFWAQAAKIYHVQGVSLDEIFGDILNILFKLRCFIYFIRISNVAGKTTWKMISL